NPAIGQLVLQNLASNSPGGIPPGSTRQPASQQGFTVDGYRDFENFVAGIDPSRFNFRAFTPAIPAMEKAMYFVTGRYKIFVDGINGDFNIKDNGFISRFGYDTGFVYERFDELRIDSGDAVRSLIRAGINGTLLASGIRFDPFIGQNAPVVGIAPTFTNGVQT